MGPRSTILSVFLIITSICFGQSAKPFHPKYRRFYSEKNTFWSDTAVRLKQKVCKNYNHIIDLTHCHTLSIIISDSLKAKQLKTLNINRDTTIIKCLFDSRSVWDMSKKEATFNGTIHINYWKKDSINVRLHITVVDERHHKTYKFKGSKTFTRTINVDKRALE